MDDQDDCGAHATAASAATAATAAAAHMTRTVEKTAAASALGEMIEGLFGGVEAVLFGAATTDTAATDDGGGDKQGDKQGAPLTHDVISPNHAKDGKAPAVVSDSIAASPPWPASRAEPPLDDRTTRARPRHRTFARHRESVRAVAAAVAAVAVVGAAIAAATTTAMPPAVRTSLPLGLAGGHDSAGPLFGAHHLSCALSLATSLWWCARALRRRTRGAERAAAPCRAAPKAAERRPCGASTAAGNETTHGARQQHHAGSTAEARSNGSAREEQTGSVVDRRFAEA